MALIKCPECGREFSDLSRYCPKCGLPIEQARLRQEEMPTTPRPTSAPQQAYRENTSMTTPPFNSAYRGQTSPYYVSDSQNKAQKRKTAIIITSIACGVLLLIGVLFFFFKGGFSNDSPNASIAATDTLERRSSYPFSGYISEYKGRYDIKGTLYRQKDGTISGRYYYLTTMRKYGDKPSTYISFDGYIGASGDVNMTATAHRGNKETWKGKLTEDNYGNFSFTGTMYGHNDPYRVFDVWFANE